MGSARNNLQDCPVLVRLHRCDRRGEVGRRIVFSQAQRRTLRNGLGSHQISVWRRRGGRLPEHRAGFRTLVSISRTCESAKLYLVFKPHWRCVFTSDDWRGYVGWRGVGGGGFGFWGGGGGFGRI